MIFKICDGIWYEYILAYFAAHDDKDIFLLTKTLFGFLFPVNYQYWYEASEMWEVWTLCTNVGIECKVLGTEGEGSVPNFSFYISLHIAAQSQNAGKNFLVCFMMTTLQLTVMFAWKEEGLRMPCFLYIVKKGTLKTLYHIVCSNINFDSRKWILKKCFAKPLA